MSRDVKLSRVDSVFEELEYPISREAAADELGDVTLLLADGEVNLGGTIAGSGSESFESRDDLGDELHNVLPRRAVGEPYQSEGDG